MIRLQEELPADVRRLLPVYEGVLFKVPERPVEETKHIVLAVMEPMCGWNNRKRCVNLGNLRSASA